mmetsp:Transcript_22679/g.34275  ORF Transcript_22679/g.34275 Transcript_22679/m.34275 type:complete len:282 (+) Transcript_22679:197-1042(+)
MNKDNGAIDFMQLMRDEKRRAKLEKQKIKQSNLKDREAKTDMKQKVLCIPPWPKSFQCDNIPPLDHAQHKVSNVGNIYYISQFLSKSHQKDLIKWLQLLPEAEIQSEHSPAGQWNKMKYGKRRVALFDHKKELPGPLRQLAQILVEAGVFSDENYAPNHVLINEYQPGQGILAHTDGPAYHAKTATLSLGQSSVLLNFCPRLKTHEIGQVTAEIAAQIHLEGDGSLVVFSDDAYTNFTHSIEEIDAKAGLKEIVSNICCNAKPGTFVDRGYRLSLTFRHHF